MNNRVLTIRGRKINKEEHSEEYLFHGISNRDFEREFTLAEHVNINNAININGILTIYLERNVPESMKPKTIDIVYLK